jgi:CubicO group peptidase (beta-lactamase class C family)
VHPTELIAQWPGRRHGAIVLRRDPAGELDSMLIGGLDPDQPMPWASVTKLVVALGTMVAVEEGLIRLEDQAGPPGSTIRHLLSHASGLALDEPRAVAAPGTRRIYSNAGYELLSSHLERWSGASIGELLSTSVLEPLGMASCRLEGSPAWGMQGPLEDLARIAAEAMEPTLLSASLAAEMRSVQFPELAGVVPGFGRAVPCHWGLGYEIKGGKDPHWTGRRWDPSSFGHFGRSGSFLLVDGGRELGVVSLGDEAFGPWAAAAWPAFLDAVVEEAVG